MTRRFFLAIALLPLVPVRLANRLLRSEGWRVIPPSPVRRTFVDGCLSVDLENHSRVLYRVWPPEANYAVPWVPQQLVFHAMTTPAKFYWVSFQVHNPRICREIYW